MLAKTSGETLKEHTIQCLNVMRSLKTLHPMLFSASEWELLEQAVIAHDLGKVNELFQIKMRNGGKLPLNIEKREIPHGYLSPAMLDKHARQDKTEQVILVNAVFYHHDREKLDWDEIKAYIKNNLSESWNEVSFQSRFLRRKLRTAYSNEIQELENLTTEEQLRYILIKGSLNRIDYCASAGRETIEEDTLTSDGKTIAQCTQDFLEQKGYGLREMQKYLKEQAGENVIVTASTGSGKTEGALLWLGGRKGFYTLPLKVSINAIYERIRKNDILYTPAVLLHSDAKGYYVTHETDDEDGMQNRYETARLFAAPLTITTIDQLFRFVFRINGTEAAAAALATACLVMDEIQMYSPDILAVILYALKMITSMGGTYLIMTATFPKILYDFFDDKGIPYRIPPKGFHGDYTRRHRIRFYENTELLDCQDDILQQAETKRVLVLCNTVGKATEVYNSLHTYSNEIRLLHSRFLKRDRRVLEHEIEAFAPNDPKREKRHGIWIATQIVEASLDIDFDVLYTELCSVDSLLQRMGRVYRSRWYDLDTEPNVYIFDSGNTGNGYVINDAIYQFSKQAVEKYDGELLEESDFCDIKERMMDEVYDPALNPAIKKEYWNELKEKWDELEHLAMYQYDSKDHQTKIRDIRSETVIPERVLLELNLNGTFERWKEEEKSCKPVGNETEEQRKEQRKRRALLHEEMLSYTVDIPKNMGFEVLYEYPFDEIWMHSNVRLCQNRYDPNMGLMRDTEQGEDAIFL